MTITLILAIILVIIWATTKKSDQSDYYRKKNQKSNDRVITDIISNAVEKTNLNKTYKNGAKDILYNIVKRIQKKIGEKMVMSPSKSAKILLTENRKIINKSRGKIKKIIVIGDKRYIIGSNNKIIDIVDVYIESYGYNTQTDSWNVSINVGDEVPAPDGNIACIGQEGQNPLCPKNLPLCCYGPTNPPQGVCKEECIDDFDTFYDDYLPSLLFIIGTSVLAAVAAGSLVGGGFIIIGIVCIVMSVIMLILQALESSDTTISDIWELIKAGLRGIFDNSEIDRPYEEDRLLSEKKPFIDSTSEAVLIGNNQNVDNIVADDMEGSTGTSGNDAYVSVKDLSSKGISKVLLELTLLPGNIDRNVNRSCERDIECGNVNRRQNESRQEHMHRLKCCLTPSDTYRPDVSINLPEPDFPRDLTPPLVDNSLNCTNKCFNGYPGIVCTDRETGEVVSETYQSSQDVSKCCRNECIDDTWHTVCPPHEGIDSGISCEDRPPKL